MLYNASEPAYDLMMAVGITPKDLEAAMTEEINENSGVARMKLKEAGIKIEDFQDPYYITVVAADDVPENFYQEVIQYDNGWDITGIGLTPGGDLDIHHDEVEQLAFDEVIDTANIVWYINHYNPHKDNEMHKSHFEDVADAQKYLMDLAY